jgi:NADH-quinone oxidoreductase subunit L
MNQLIFLPILIPLAGALLVLLMPKRRGPAEVIALVATLMQVAATVILFNKNITVSLPWSGFGFDLSLRAYQFSGFIVLAVAGFGFLTTLYSSAFMAQKNAVKSFYVYLLISLSFACGAVLSDNLVLMLFFWEGLLLSLFGMIYIGNKNAFKAATKAFIIVGISDLCMMIGIALAGSLSGTFAISEIKLSLAGLGGLAFILLMIGAIGKAGSMPFHSWIPDAATDAPLPFMAIIPGSLEKLLGIYFLTRLSLDMFSLTEHSWISTLLMIIGALTILFAVMMALVQKNYKRLLSYHAVSQVGYMVLGIGTMVPAGIIGGLFHMINNALYKNCLFLTGGAVEKQAGETDLESLGGLRLKMPVTFICFVIAAASISGVPPFNGFFSKELVYDGALERGWIFYAAALLGSFLTAASFLKLGHAAFLGSVKEAHKKVKEAPLAMLVPMIVIAGICIFFGVANYIPIKGLIQPILGPERLEGHNFSGMPANTILIFASIVVLILAIAHHFYGVKKNGSGLKAVEHIHHAPGLSQIYRIAEAGYLDPYNIGMFFARIFAYIGWAVDRVIDFILTVVPATLAVGLSWCIRKAHTGNYSLYILWSLAAAVGVIIFLMRSLLV